MRSERAEHSEEHLMELLSWRQVDFAGVLVAGLAAGYVMQLAGLWAASIPGLVGFDMADFGRRYITSDRPSAWLLGMASHLANSVLFVLAFAMAIVPNLHVPRLLLGLAWGEVLALVLSGALLSPLAGLGFLGRKTGSPRYALTSILLHALWGLVVGILYVP
jgi:hypothetical protein